MAVLVAPEMWFLQGPATDVEATKLRTSAAAFRRMLDGMLGRTQGVQYTVNNPVDLKVLATGTPDGFVHVQAGACYVRGTQAATQGMYHLYNDATLDINVLGPNPAHATLDRIDLVVARYQDQFYSGSLDLPTIEMVTGTPSGSPGVPAAPANSLILAQISIVHASATIPQSVITDRRVPAGLNPVKIYDNQLLAAAASFTIVVPPGGSHLRITASLRTTNAGAGGDVVAGQANGDTAAANYDSWRHFALANGGAWSITALQGVTIPPVGLYLGNVPQTGTPAGMFNKLLIECPNYSDSVSHKRFFSRGFYEVARATASMITDLFHGHWNSTAALTQLVLLLNAGTYDIGSRVVAEIIP